MKIIDMHKRLLQIKRNLEQVMKMVKEEDVKKELEEIKREVMKMMIRIEYETWKEGK